MEKNDDKEYDDLRDDLRDIKSIALDTRDLLLRQGDELNLITENVEETTENTISATKDIKTITKKMNKSSILFGSLAGMALLTPVGIGLGLTGLPLGLLCSAGGLVGLGIGKK